jgi:hypothetical protein
MCRLPYSSHRKIWAGETMKILNWAFQSALFAAVSVISSGAAAQDIETRSGYCNDSYFDSDGAGISGCMEYAVKYGTDTFGIGLFGATPELKQNTPSDPLDELARINAWYGREFESDVFHYSVNARAGIEGGAADDVAISIKEALHDVFGAGNKKLKSTRDTTFIGGVSGWGRHDSVLSESDSVSAIFTSYLHAALGNDTIEGGGGLMLALQPASETKGLALVMPKNGAYAPTFGGDGIGIFAGVRGVALETLYDDLANPVIAEAGIMGQMTFWGFAVVGVSASCTTESYDGADKADCKAMFQTGGSF